MASPVRSFCRHTSRPVDIGDVTVPENARVMMLFASANRDHREFPNPDKFDITRNPRHHLGFGSGIHMCVGMHLAQMEMVALLTAMMPQVKEIRVGEPVIALNTTIHSFASLPTEFIRVSKNPIVRRLDKSVEDSRAFLQGRIVAREQVAEGIIGLEIKPLDGQSFPAWTPGAHVDTHVNDGLIRQYSLTGPVRRDRYEIAILREPQSRGGSSTIHAKFETGSLVTLSRPRNYFSLDESRSQKLLFSGGIGITPIFAMAWRLHFLGREFTWHASARSEERFPWPDRLAALPFREKLHVHLDDGPPDQQLDMAEVLSAVDSQTQVYVCGPRSYMDHVIRAALSTGIPKDNIRQEHFTAEIDVDGDPFDVVAARSNKRFEVSANETIVDAALRAEIVVETSCRNGICGTCLTRVLRGRPHHRDMVPDGIREG